MFEPRVALASLSGEADSEWARAAAPHAGLAFLGGISVDAESRAAARELLARDRNEFLPEDPFAFVAGQLDALADAEIAAAVNVRSATVDPVRRVARICAARDAVLEVNAHCRQDELCAVGCGESLLRDTDRLCEYVAAAADEGAAVSVKVRTEVPGVDLAETTRRVADAGASMVHVDAMDSEGVVADVARAAAEAGDGDDADDEAASAAPFVVANNEVRDRESVREYLAYGADAVSVGRPSTDPRVLRRVRRAVDEWFAGDGDCGGGRDDGDADAGDDRSESEARP